MSTVPLGDMAKHFTALRNSNAIKSDLFKLTDSLSTGRISDLTESLGGETTRFSGLRHTLTQLDGYLQVGSETGQTLSNVQIILDKVDGSRGRIAERLLLVSDSSTTTQIDEAAQAAQSGFQEIVSALNTQIADRALMSGNRVDAVPLAAAGSMLTDMQTAIGGAVDPAAIITIVQDWFSNPAGGFVNIGYLGDSGTFPTRQLTENLSIRVDARADDPAIRQVLQGAALAALANDLPGLDRNAKVALLRESASQLYSAASGIAAVQARVGFAEEGVSRALTEVTAQQTSLRVAENDLVLVDPFETASRLQATQQQLETFFTLTARMSQLSLLRFI